MKDQRTVCDLAQDVKMSEAFHSKPEGSLEFAAGEAKSMFKRLQVSSRLHNADASRACGL